MREVELVTDELEGRVKVMPTPEEFLNEEDVSRVALRAGLETTERM
jgi:hypothetical protein